MPNSHLVLHKEALKHTLKNKISIKHLIKIINFGTKNCPVGRNGLNLWLLTDKRSDYLGDTVDEELAVGVDAELVDTRPDGRADCQCGRLNKIESKKSLFINS